MLHSQGLGRRWRMRCKLQHIRKLPGACVQRRAGLVSVQHNLTKCNAEYISMGAWATVSASSANAAAAEGGP